MKVLYYTSKLYWVGIFSLVGQYFYDYKILKYMTFLCFLSIIYSVMNFTLIKDSFLQIKGINKLKKRHESVEDFKEYKNEVEYSLPFSGKWVCVNGGLTKEFSHSWDIPTQRYAYDFIILDDENKSHLYEADKVENYYCYGKEILAPADGKVIKISNRSKDSIILKRSKVILRSDNIAGNHIIIRHSENEYSFIAHIKKDTFTVSEGDEVCRGQVIARCGNSGMSTEPHVHFHVQKGESFYESLGLPIIFRGLKKYKIQGYDKYDDRKCMEFEEIANDRVYRGYAYENAESDNRKDN